MRRTQAPQLLIEEHRLAALLFETAERSQIAARECARGAAAAALVSIASSIASAAAGIPVALVLAAALLARRIRWLRRERSERANALAAEMAASFTASEWQSRTG